MKNYKDDYIELKNVVESLKKRYKFQGLLHFTDFENLKSIFEMGMLGSRRACEENNVEFVDGANHEVINRANDFVHESTRFYYRDKTPTLYVNEGIKQEKYCGEVHIPRPVYLLFSEELIYLNNTSFSNGNATNSLIDNTAKFFREMDWENIFHKGFFEPNERDYIINKRQAELLSSNPVELKYLKKIIFRSEADLKQAIRIWGVNDMYSVDCRSFSEKNNLSIDDSRYNNYIENYEIEENKDNFKIKIILKKSLQNYEITWRINDKNGINKNELIVNTKEVETKDIDGVIIPNPGKNPENVVEIKMKFNYEPKVGDCIDIFMNGFLCIEEIIKK